MHSEAGVCRKLGAVIDTLQDAHSGPFAGFHARYMLRSSVTVLEIIGGPS
jgi:hypothetical protein